MISSKSALESKPLILEVNRDMCLACGRCAMSCFRGAISLESGKAHIDSSKCNGCGMCINACAQGAIMESVPVSKEESSRTVSDLKLRIENALRRINALKGLFSKGI